MQPGCFQCFESLWMGLKKSKPRRNKENFYDEGLIDVITSHQVTECEPVHTDAVTCVAGHSEGLCLSGSADRTVVLFDLKTGTVNQRWAGHEREITRVVHSREQTIFSSSRDKTIRLWKNGVCDPIDTYKGHKLVVTGIDLSQDQTLLFSGSRDNIVMLWDVSTGKCTRQNEVTRNLVSCVKWIPNSHEVVQTGEDKMVRLWDTRTLTPAYTFPPKQYFQTCCDCSRDGKYILTCNNGFNRSGCEATLWDLRQKRQVHQYTGHTQTTSACLFLPFTEDISPHPLIATASHDSTLRVWKRDTKECLLIEEFPGSGPLTSLTSWADGGLCVSSFHVGVYHLNLQEKDDGRLMLKRMVHF